MARGRIAYIDGLRGIAALAVVARHSSEVIVTARPADDHVATAAGFLFSETINFGRFGVVLFFMISGFVIPFSFKPP